MRKSSLLVVTLALGALAAPALADPLDTTRLRSDANALFQPLAPIAVPKDSLQAARAELGRRLFFENRVSMDGNVSCSHCHLPDKQASDGLPKAIGVFGKENPRNAPSIFNAAMNFKQH
jgi:cytochrome c peroxidase